MKSCDLWSGVISNVLHWPLTGFQGHCTSQRCVLWDVKRSSNYMFEFVFQPFGIRFQAALNRRWPFGLQSVALCSHSKLPRLDVRCDFFVLCRAVNTSDAVCFITSPLPSCLPSHRSIAHGSRPPTCVAWNHSSAHGWSTPLHAVACLGMDITCHFWRLQMRDAWRTGHGQTAWHVDAVNAAVVM